MLLIKELRSSLNTQSDSISANSLCSTGSILFYLTFLFNELLFFLYV